MAREARPLNPFAALSPVPYENLYHMGIVVPEIEVAMAELGEQLGVTWAPPRVFPVSMREGGELRSYGVTATYSREGPPYFELMEAVGDSVWNASYAGQLHHIGVYAEDAAKEIARLEATGFTVEAQGLTPDGKPLGPTYLTNRFGLRIELGSAVGRQMIADWVSEPASP